MNNYGNSFGFNGMNNDNPLAQLLRQYVPQQATEAPKPTPEPQRTNTGGIVAYEINSKSDIEYIEPDKSGRRQIYICEPENKVYTGRYNHVRGAVDYRAYIDEGEVSLFQKNDADSGMTQIAEALVAVVSKLEAMDGKIQALTAVVPAKEESQRKAAAPAKEEIGRKSNGQFKKKGES